jgi:hypothetical protein
LHYAAWFADLHTPGEGGKTEFATVSARAKQGAAWAIEKLKGPRFPESLGYLWRLFNRIRKGLKKDLDGKREMTWEGLEAFANAADVDIQPHEYDALFELHDVVNDPRSFLEPKTNG